MNKICYSGHKLILIIRQSTYLTHILTTTFRLNDAIALEFDNLNIKYNSQGGLVSRTLFSTLIKGKEESTPK